MKKTTESGAQGSRKSGATGSGAGKTRTYAKPAMNGGSKPRTYAKPAPDGGSKPRSFGKPVGDGAGKPRTYAKPVTDGGSKPRSFGKPAGDGAGKPRTYAKPAPDGGSKPRSFGKPVGDGAGKPRTYAKPAGDGAGKPKTYGKAVVDGDRKPLTNGKPVIDGDQKPGTYEKPTLNSDRKPRPFERPTADTGEKRRYASNKPGADFRGRKVYGTPKSAPGAEGGKKPYAPRERSTARDVALRALQDVTANGAFAAQALDRQLESVRLLPDDRRLATSIFYAAVENRIRIAHILRAFVRNADPEITDVFHIACAQLLYLDKVPDHAIVDEAVKQARALKGHHIMGFVNGVLRNVIRARDAGDLLAPKEGEESVAANVEFSIAPELMDKLIEAFGEELASEIAAYQPERRLQTVRPNLMTTTDEQLGNDLTEKGIKWEMGIVPHAFLCENAGALANLDGYRTGKFSIQGEGSMLAARAVEAKPGMNVLDACAAPGGKSALLCEMMSGTGRVYAWDVYEHRVELIRAAGRRLKLYNLRPTVRDARTPYEPFDAFLDAVLVDAPCSGLGVMADKPDLRLKFDEADLKDLVQMQREILDHCAKLVKVDGLLIYSTCTILPEENEKQVRHFLAHNPQFALEQDVSYLPESLRPRAKDGMIQLFQHKDGIEGFFIARMRRKCL